MPLLKGSQTFRIYRTTEPAPKDAADRLLHRVHKPSPDARTKEPTLGWVAIDDDTHAPDAPHFGQALAFSCRIDRKRVPGRALKIAVEARQREVMKERGLERLGKNHKREIAEAVEEDLLQRALPTITTVDVLWVDAEVYVFTSSPTTADLVRGLFFDTFGVRLYPDRLCDWLATDMDRGKVEALCRRLPGGSAAGGRAGEVNAEGWHENDPMAGRIALVGSDFLRSLLPGDDTLSLDGKAALSDWETDGKTTLVGTSLDASIETAHAAGQRVNAARFVWAPSSGGETHFGLRLSDAGFTWAGVKLPTDCKDDVEPMVLEREFLLTRLVSEVRRRFIGWFQDGEETA